MHYNFIFFFLFFFLVFVCVYFFFFFQAEDGIRDRTVTGVQTCALPISSPMSSAMRRDTASVLPEPAHAITWRCPPRWSIIFCGSGDGLTFCGMSLPDMNCSFVLVIADTAACRWAPKARPEPPAVFCDQAIGLEVFEYVQADSFAPD